MEPPTNLWFDEKVKDAVRLVLKKHRDLIPAFIPCAGGEQAGYVIPSIRPDDLMKVMKSITRGVCINHTGKVTCTVKDTTIVLPVVTIMAI